MKSIASIISIVLLLCGNLSYGQDCDTYLLLTEGTMLEYTNFDKKGKAITVGKHFAESVDSEGGKYTSKIKLEVKDLKKDDTFNMEYDVGCEDSIVSIDMSRFFDSAQLMQYEGSDFDINIEGDMLYFPRELKEGETLNDGNITVKVNKDNFTMVTMTLTIMNRKVLGKEPITTKAGTFDCQKVSYDFESKFGILKVKGSAAEWYHDDRVIIKSESYNKKGKLTGSSELTALSN